MGRQGDTRLPPCPQKISHIITDFHILVKGLIVGLWALFKTSRIVNWTVFRSLAFGVGSDFAPEFYTSIYRYILGSYLLTIFCVYVAIFFIAVEGTVTITVIMQLVHMTNMEPSVSLTICNVNIKYSGLDRVMTRVGDPTFNYKFVASPRIIWATTSKSNGSGWYSSHS